MYLIEEIEINDELIEVEFEGEIAIENDGIGHYEYWGQKCYDKGHDYPVLYSCTWERSLFTDEQNDEIEKYLDKNIKQIEDEFINLTF